MKAITLWQPWASLLACGAKLYETRSWATHYRGRIAIHAAKHVPKGLLPWPPDFDDACCAALGHNKWMNALPFGMVIATAELVACHPIVCCEGRCVSEVLPGWLETRDGIYEPTEQEKRFGDWMPGRYAWEFANMKRLPEPIPAKGHQRIWNWDGGVYNRI